MATILALVGSLRQGSYNLLLARAAAELAPTSVKVDIASIRGIPLYDGDVEARDGIPAEVDALKARIIAADGLLLVTPEYNNSIPGAFKNAIDWLSRPGSDIPRVFGERPTGVIGATPGPGGTRLSQNAWLPVLRVLGTRPYFGKSVFVASAAQAFEENGTLHDEKLKSVLTGYMAAFSAFVSDQAKLSRSGSQ
jgi:NAD(P)H-dependent FMN reductase